MKTYALSFLLCCAALAATADYRFSFDAPAGPQFPPEQKAAQFAAGSNVVPLVLAAYRKGDAAVRIPPGDYRFGHERWNRDGVVFPLEFAGLCRDKAHPFTIDATGATFWFDLPDDQAPKCHFCVGFRNCSNVVFRGATIDRGTRGHVEGRIAAIDFANNRIQLRVSPGCVVPATFSDGLEQRVLPFKADGTFCAPLYALQAGGTRLKYRHITQPDAAGLCWVEMRETALLDRIRDRAWLKACGEQGVLRVGDGLSCVYTVTSSLELIDCERITVEGLRVYATKAWGAEIGGTGAHVWKDCFFGPRPGTSQWQGGEGFMFNGTRHGTTLDNVTILHTADDCANFHGYWSRVAAIAGPDVTFGIHDGNRRLLPAGTTPGDRVVFYHSDSGRPLGEARVTAVATNGVTIDRPAADFANAIVEWPDHACAGWTIRNCTWHDCYQRVLIQSGPGTIRDSTFARLGSRIELNFHFPYIEGGIPRDITIENNVFTDVNPQPGGAVIDAVFHTFKRLETNLANNIVIRGNTFDRPETEAIRLARVSGLVVTNNRFSARGAGLPRP